MSISWSRRAVRVSILVAALLVFLIAAALPTVAQGADPCNPGPAITLASVGLDGLPANGNSNWSSISADGRYVVFSSAASNLIPGDTNGVDDIFVYDRLSCQITRVSVATGGGQADNYSAETAISGDGRYVTFSSFASNLVLADANAKYDIFVHDRQTGETARVSLALDGAEADQDSRRATISGDGRYVAFYSFASNVVNDDTNNTSDIFVFDRQTGQNSRITKAFDEGEANGPSSWSAISGDGRYVAFYSFASNLVDDDANDTSDIFVFDRQTGQTKRVSVAADGTEADGPSLWPSISGDGRYVAFYSSSANLRGDGVDNPCNAGVGQGPCPGVFVHDRQTGQTTLISVTTDRGLVNQGTLLPSISGDGRYIAYASSISYSDNSSVIFVYDQTTGQNHVISSPAGDGSASGNSSLPTISGDGQYVAFQSNATNLGSGGLRFIQDIFVVGLTQDTATSTPLPPTSAPPTLHVQYTVGYTDPTSREIAAYLKVFNTGISSISLSSLKIRYWFTRDNAPSMLFHCTYASVGCENITSTFVDLSTAADGADSYVEIGFGGSAGDLAGYNQLSEVDLVIGRGDEASFDQSNDYSFDASQPVHESYSRVTLYWNGALIWGVEPAPAQPMTAVAPTFEPVPTIMPPDTPTAP